jgi:hypothetical protein
MPRYKVSAYIATYREIEVDADNEDEAKEAALETYYDSEYDDSDDECGDPQVLVIKEIEDNYDPTENDDA